MKYQIISDSTCDLDETYLKDKNIGFHVVPLTIGVGDKEFSDTPELDIREMLTCMQAYKGKCRSACPAPDSFLSLFDQAEFTFVVTVTGKLSGSFNSAETARNMYPHADHVFVVDSKQTSGALVLLIDKLVELIEEGKDFETITKEIVAYRDQRNLLFSLQRFDNLIANGRMSKIAALIASTLVIRPICKAEDGEIKMAKKLIGSKNAHSKMVDMIGTMMPETEGKTIIVTHCFLKDEAQEIKRKIEEKYNFKEVRLYQMAGLNSFYALEKGVIICF